MATDSDEETDDGPAGSDGSAEEERTEASSPEVEIDDADRSNDADRTEEEAIPETAPEHAVSESEQTWAILTHASGLLGLVVPLGNILGPLLLWLIKREESAFVDESGKAALNFQITWTLLLFLALLSLVVGIGLLLVPAVALAWLILVVIGTARASDREVYDYPLTIEFIE